MQVQVKFLAPNNKVQGEGKSKLLSPQSELYEWIMNIRNKLTDAKISFDARPPHIEISKDANLSASEFTKRAQTLENTYVSKDLYVLADNALVVYTGILNFYGITHATIAYFKEGLSEQQYDTIVKLVNGTANGTMIAEFKEEASKKEAPRTKVYHADWWCSTCEFKIFGSKAECRKCGALRPT